MLSTSTFAKKSSPKTNKAKTTKIKKMKKKMLSSKSPIYVDGQFNKSGQDLTSAERIRKLRRKLEKQHEVMVKNRIELIRFQREVQMMKRVEKAMNEIMNGLDKI